MYSVLLQVCKRRPRWRMIASLNVLHLVLTFLKFDLVIYAENV